MTTNKKILVKKKSQKQVISEKTEAKKEAGRKKKLLILTDNFLPRWDGISRFLSETIPRLKNKYAITVVAPDYGVIEDSAYDDVNIIKIPVRQIRWGDFNPAKYDYKKIKQEVKKSDIVFSQTIGPIGLAGLKAAKKTRKKVISFIHSIEWELLTRAVTLNYFTRYLQFIAKWFVRRIYKKVNLLIVPSDNTAEMLTWQNIKTPKKVIHLGVDTKKFFPPKDKAIAKRNMGISEEDFVIGHHGRIAREKDLPTLLRAFIMVKKNNPNVKLLIVGEGIESIKRKLASIPGVILPGSTNNVVPFLQAMDLYCLPSLTETTSLATLEAMACGVPVIATKVGFVKDYIKPRFNGMFFQERNSYDLMRKIEFLMKHDTLRENLSDNARKIVEKEFDWNKTAKEIEETIDEMITSKSLS